MKNTFLKYIKISLMLVLLMQAVNVQAQIPYTDKEGFATIVSSTCATTNVSALGTGNEVMVNKIDAVVHGRWTNAYTNGTGVDAYIKTYFHGTPYEIELELNDGTFTPKLSTTAAQCIQAAASTTCFVNNNGGACSTVGANVTTSMWYLPIDFSSFTIPSGKLVVGARVKLIDVPGSPDIAKFIITTNALKCAAGNTVPTLSSTSISASCPANTANLNSLVTSTLPSGATLKWYTDTTHTTEVTTPTAVGVSGTYYAFYVDTVNNCFSPASAAVTVTANCPINVATTCPDVSIDLASRVVSTVPSGYSITYHSGTPATNANKLTSSVVNTAGTYYLSAYFAAQDCYLNTGRPMVVTITNCCATVTPTWN